MSSTPASDLSKPCSEQTTVNDTDDKRNVFVAGLLPAIGDEDLYFIFRPYGPICLSEVLRDSRSGISRCLGFVEFESPDGAERAILETNRQQITVTLPSQVSPSHSASRTMVLTLRTRLAARYSPPHRGGEVLSAETNPSQLHLYMPPTVTNKLFIRRVPLFATPETLSKHFSQFGHVAACTIHRDASRRRLMEGSSGEWNMAYVVFSTVHEAAAATRVEHANMELGPHGEVHYGPLLVKLAETLEQRRVRQLTTSPQRRPSGRTQQQQPNRCEYSSATDRTSALTNVFPCFPATPDASVPLFSVPVDIGFTAPQEAAASARMVAPPSYAEGPSCPTIYRSAQDGPRIAMRGDFVPHNVDSLNGMYHCSVSLPVVCLPPQSPIFVSNPAPCGVPSATVALLPPRLSESYHSSKPSFGLPMSTSASGWGPAPTDIPLQCFYVVNVAGAVSQA